MGATKLMRGCSQHSLIERALLHVVPNTFAGQLVFDNCSLARGDSVKPIAVEHFKTIDLPTPPVLNFAPESNRYAGQIKIKIGQVCHLFPVKVAALYNHAPPPAR